MNSGIEPSTSSTETISPQRIISPRFAWAARHDADIASPAVTSRSTSIGSETTLMRKHQPAEHSADHAAKRDQHPALGVVNTIVRNSGSMLVGAAAEQSDINRARGHQPGAENRQQHPRDDPDIVGRRRTWARRGNAASSNGAPLRGAAPSHRNRRRRRPEQTDPGDDREQEGSSWPLVVMTAATKPIST